MSIVDALTPVYYKLNRIYVFREGGEVIATAELAILNAAGHQVAGDNPTTSLMPTEKQALAAFIERELTAYEAATGLTEWTE